MGIRKAFITTIVLCASCLCVAYGGEESQRQVAGENQVNNAAKFNLATYNIRYYSKRDSLKGNICKLLSFIRISPCIIYAKD